MCAVLIGNGCYQLSGHNRFDDDWFFRQHPLCLTLREQIIRQQSAHFITGHQPIFLAVAHSDPNAVAIRIGGEQQIRWMRFCHLQCALKRLPDLRVRKRAGGEIAVRMLLLWHNLHIGNARTVQHFAHRLVACAVERGIDHFQARVCTNFRIDTLGKHPRIKFLDQAIFNETDSAIPACFVKIHPLNALEEINLLDAAVSFLCRLVRHLVTLRVIALIAVVFCRIVACCNNNAGLAAQPAHCKREHWRRHELPEKMHYNAIRREYTGSLTRKEVRFNP